MTDHRCNQRGRWQRTLREEGKRRGSVMSLCVLCRNKKKTKRSEQPLSVMPANVHQRDLVTCHPNVNFRFGVENPRIPCPESVWDKRRSINKSHNLYDDGQHSLVVVDAAVYLLYVLIWIWHVSRRDTLSGEGRISSNLGATHIIHIRGIMVERCYVN